MDIVQTPGQPIAEGKNVLTSAHRVLTALRIICLSTQPVSLARLAQELQVPQATAYRTAQTLIAAGFVQIAGDGRQGYEATWQIVELSSVLLDRTELRTEGQPFLRPLADKYGESVTLAIPDGDHALFVDRINGARGVEFYCNVGRRLPLHVGAAARAMLAHYPEPMFEEYIHAELAQFTQSTQVAVDALREDRSRTRTRGFAFSKEDVEIGISGVAAPILNAKGEVLGAAAIANLSARWTDDDIEERAEMLIDACRRLGAHMGHQSQSLQFE